MLLVSESLFKQANWGGGIFLMLETTEIYKERCKKLLENGRNYQDLNNYEYFKDLFSYAEYKELVRIKANRRNKRNRTKNKFKEILILKQQIENSTLVFGTITLNDKNLSMKENTYIRKIHSWLKSHFLIAILNKDFGDKTGREHYHFLGLTTEEVECMNHKSKKGYLIYELKDKTYTMGHEPDLLLVDLKKDDLDKTTNYLLKLNNHTSKDSTKSRVRVIKQPLFEYLYLQPMKNAKNGIKMPKNSTFEKH